jgi:hypothetical protein
VYAKDCSTFFTRIKSFVTWKISAHKAIYTLCCGILRSIWITRNKLVLNVVDSKWDKIYDLTFHRSA